MRSFRGNSILELPVVLFAVLVGLGFPLTGLATLTYRTALFHAVVRQSCTEAARARSFSEARTIAQSVISKGCSSFTGITTKQCVVSIVTKNIATNKESESFVALPNEVIDTEKYLYFIKVTADGKIKPMVESANGLAGVSIVGYSQPYDLTTSMKLFAERPRGLAR